MSGHPFNGIITSLFIRARPERYITSLCSGLASRDKRPSLGRWRTGGQGWGVNVCPLIAARCLPQGFTNSLLARLNSLPPASGEHQECCTLVSRVTWTTSHGAWQRGNEQEKGMKGKERERKASIIQHGPDPCIRAPLKIGNPYRRQMVSKWSATGGERR